MTALIHLPTLKEASAFAGTEHTRYYLMGVNVIVEPHSVTYVATNGHIMFVRRMVTNDPNTTCGTWIIPVEHCKAFKLAKRDTEAMASLTVSEDGKRLSLSYNGDTRTFQPIDGSFPNWQMVIPQSVSGVMSNAFNGDYLAAIQECGRKLGLGPMSYHWNGDSASIFTWDDTGLECFALLMPMRLTGTQPEWVKPSWLSPSPVAVKEAA